MPDIEPVRWLKKNFPVGIDETYPMDKIDDMDLLKTWLAGERGRSVGLARHLGVPASFVSRMATGDRPIPVEHGASIEAFTGGAVTRRQMFPNDWQRVWPEIASTDSMAANDPQASQREDLAAMRRVIGLGVPA